MANFRRTRQWSLVLSLDGRSDGGITYLQFHVRYALDIFQSLKYTQPNAYNSMSYVNPSVSNVVECGIPLTIRDSLATRYAACPVDTSCFSVLMFRGLYGLMLGLRGLYTALVEDGTGCRFRAVHRKRSSTQYQ
jgi:hypothetical protein